MMVTVDDLGGTRVSISKLSPTDQQILLDFIIMADKAGRPRQNGHVESFNGRLRDECLNANWFRNLVDAREKMQPGEMSTIANGPTAVWAIGRPTSLPKY